MFKEDRTCKINRNMRCIEIVLKGFSIQIVVVINRNMRCIEIQWADHMR